MKSNNISVALNNNGITRTRHTGLSLIKSE